MAQELTTLRRYTLEPDKKYGTWAIIVIDTKIGYFSVVSDYGNYAFRWTHPGGEFRKFLAGLEPDYVYSKLTHTQRMFDLEGSRDAVLKAFTEIREAQTRPESWVDREYDDFESVHSESEFMMWVSNTEMEDPHEFFRTKKEPDCWRFVRHLFSRFQLMLREELQKETNEAKKQEAGGS